MRKSKNNLINADHTTLTKYLFISGGQIFLEKFN